MRRLLACSSLALVAACGTTVPGQSNLAGASGNGLGAPVSSATSAATTGGGTGLTVPGTSSTGLTQPGGGSTSSGTTGTAGTTGATGATASLPPLPAGTTRVATPIEIGLLTAGDLGAANSAIGRNAAPYKSADALKAMIDALNAKGGLAGRKITYVMSVIDPTSSNYDTQATAACANMTQDHHVAVAMSFEGSFFSEPFSSCLAKVHVPEIAALDGGAAQATLAKYPLLYSPAAPTTERRFRALVTGTTGNGYLTSKNHVGMVVEDCSANEAAADHVLEPMLKQRGIKVTRQDVSCAHGFGDAAALIGSFQAAVLPMRSAGADRMIFVSGFEQVGVQFFEKQAASQSWKPHYAVTSPAGTGYNDMQLGDEALSRIQGVGWRPAKDVTQMPTTPAATRCKSLFRQYSGALDRANESASFSLCEAFFFLEAGLERSSGRSDPATLTAAWNGLGTSFASPLELAGATSFAPGHKDGPRYFSTYSFITGCSCFRYTGGPRALA